MANGNGGGDPGGDARTIGNTGAEVVGGEEVPGEGGGRNAEEDPDLEPIHGGDVSDTPAAQPGTRGAGTGADMGTGAEVGITRPGTVDSGSADDGGAATPSG